MKILLISNTAWSLINFRGGLMRALLSAGHEVVAVAPDDEHVARIEALGVRFVPLPMDNKGTNPVKDLLLIWRFVRLFRAQRPDAVILYTIKPVIYGSLAARYLGLSAISVITGLGTAFLKETWLTRVVEFLYRVSQAQVRKLYFLNQDDMRLFRQRRLAPVEVMECLPGEGVDLSYFSAREQVPESDRGFRFLLMARMLWDKGVGVYVEAARMVRAKYPEAKFGLLGFLDVQNPSAIAREQMQQWVEEGIVNYLGVTNDVRTHVAAADCVVLPSYYPEGVPRTLLEAAAMGKPIITTDATGCREVVDDGVNGFLCRTRDAADLAEKMERVIALSADERAEMGRRGREKMEREFDEQVVFARYMAVLGELESFRVPHKVGKS